MEVRDGLEFYEKGKEWLRRLMSTIVGSAKLFVSPSRNVISFPNYSIQ